MVLIEEILEEAIKQGASDIHLAPGMFPVLRITRDLVKLKQFEPMDEEKLYEVYDYIIKRKCYKRWYL